MEEFKTQQKEILIKVRNLSCSFGFGKKKFKAIKNIDFNILDEEIVTIVGESGSGKTTLARMLLNLQERENGDILYKNKEISGQGGLWRDIQSVFQDPFASFNQFYSVHKQLDACFRLLPQDYSRDNRTEIIKEVLSKVNLQAEEVLYKYPFELSGGQLQRLLIARIFIIKPKVLIADEPTSMFDACTKISILDLLLKLKKELKMCIIFITHDIGLAYYVSDRIFVMTAGEIVESGTPKDIIKCPQHDYTKRLLNDIPIMKKEWLSDKDVNKF